MDAETGSLLRLIAYACDAPAQWWNWTASPPIPAIPLTRPDSAPHIPPGTRIVEETGDPMVDVTVGLCSGLTGTAAHAAAEAFRRGTNTVSAARSFLDDLRGHR